MRFASRDKGLYLLLLEVHGRLLVGRLGTLDFSGWYVYVGSAQGPAGLKRIQRHSDYGTRTSAPLRWHVDVLLASGALRGAVVALTDERLECRLAEGLGVALSPAFPGFGSSDCACPTHLFSATSYDTALMAGCQTMAGLGLAPREVLMTSTADRLLLDCTL